MAYFADSVASDALFNSKVLVRESTSQADVNSAKDLIRRYDGGFDHGNVSSVVVASWVNVKDYRTNNNAPKVCYFFCVRAGNE